MLKPIAAAAIVLLCVVLAEGAIAKPLSGKDAANEFSSENAQCAAYYVIGEKCLGEQQDEKLRQSFKAAQSASNRSVFLFGKQAGLSDAALHARNELAVKQAIKDIDSNCQNISVLLNKYADFCKSVMEDPVARVNTLLRVGKQ